MAKITTVKNKQRRLDRIMLSKNSTLLSPKQISMVGTQSFNATFDPKLVLHPSDHYGLVCDFDVKLK